MELKSWILTLLLLADVALGLGASDSAGGSYSGYSLLSSTPSNREQLDRLRSLMLEGVSRKRPP